MGTDLPKVTSASDLGGIRTHDLPIIGSAPLPTLPHWPTHTIDNCLAILYSTVDIPDNMGGIVYVNNMDISLFNHIVYVYYTIHVHMNITSKQ